MIKTLNTLFITMFGLGKVPKIPGTFGSLTTIIILYLITYKLILLPLNLFFRKLKKNFTAEISLISLILF